MNTFKKKWLCAALTSLGVIGMAGPAQAVSLNPNGLGQVLIYPYYTVRGDASGGGSFNSLFSVVNKTYVGKAVRVRFLEGKASQEVLSFNLYLSREDVWTAAIVPTDEGARLITTDTSCTAPPIPKEGVDFMHFQYLGDSEDQTLDRTREGYVEIIEMADIPLTSPATDLASVTWKNVTHTRVNGVWQPFNCNGVQDNGAVPGWVSTDLTTGTGGLFGSMTLINVNAAQDVAYEAVALDGFYRASAPGDHLWFPSGFLMPDLSLAKPKTSVVINGTDEYITSWDEGIDAVSAVLMSESVHNEFVLDDSVAAKTDWVITMPTKKYYYDDPNPSGTRPLKANNTLFQRDFVKGGGGACDDFDYTPYDREEARVSWGFDGLPQPKPRWDLCWGTNVVTFDRAMNASIFYAQNHRTLRTPYDNGWAKFTFKRSPSYHSLTANGNTQHIDLSTSPPTSSNAVGYVYHGLPMVGFAVQQFNNGEVSSSVIPGAKVWASYAGRIAHRFDKNIALP